MKNKDYEIWYTKGSGPGGQHRNKVESCVYIKHIETGLIEKCEDTPSKIRNEKIAFKKLLLKIQKHKKDIKLEEINVKRLKQLENLKPIRTYDFKSGKVTDHRSKTKADLKKVLRDGKIDLL